MYVGSGLHRGSCAIDLLRGGRSCICGVEPSGRTRRMISPWIQRFGVQLGEERLVVGTGSAAAVTAARLLARALRAAGNGVWQTP